MPCAPVSASCGGIPRCLAVVLLLMALAEVSHGGFMTGPGDKGST